MRGNDLSVKLLAARSCVAALRTIVLPPARRTLLQALQTSEMLWLPNAMSKLSGEHRQTARNNAM